MNKKELLHAVGMIEERFIEEAETARPARSHIKFLTAAACFLLVCAVLVIPFAGGLLEPKTPSDLLPVIWDGSAGRFVYAEQIHSGQDADDYCGYCAVISSGDYQGYRSARVLDGDYVGEGLGDAEIDSFLLYFASGKTEDHRFLAAEIYEIRGISPSDAVCIRYRELGQSNTLTHDYVFWNPCVTDEALDALWNRFAFDEYLVLSDAASMLIGNEPADGGVRRVCYRIFDGMVLKALLRGMSDAPAVDMSERGFGSLAASAGTILTLPAESLASGQSGAIQILDNGYLVTGLSGSVQVFAVGEERADEVLRWLMENAEVTDSVDYGKDGLPVYDGTTDDSEETVTAETQIPHLG